MTSLNDSEASGEPEAVFADGTGDTIVGEDGFEADLGRSIVVGVCGPVLLGGAVSRGVSSPPSVGLGASLTS